MNLKGGKLLNKKDDRLTRSIEKDLKKRLSGYKKAPRKERAMAEAEAANHYLKDCQTLDEAVGAGKVVTDHPSRISDTTPDEAERWFNKNRNEFRKNFGAMCKRFPDHAEKNKSKLFRVGIDISKLRNNREDKNAGKSE